MIKIFLKKYWIALISCIISAGIVYACADAWGEEYGVSNFAPESFVSNKYSPFFYSENYYYQIGYDDNQNTRFNDANVKEWSAYLEGKLSNRQLIYLLQNASEGKIDSAILYYDKNAKSLPDSLQSFEIFKSTKDKKIANFLRYLLLAKKCEKFAVNEIYNSWNYHNKEKNPANFDVPNINKELTTGMDKSTDIFMQERYWFQLVRSAFFNQSPQDAISLYDQYEKKMPRNTMYYRTLSYTAGAFARLKDYSKSNYYFSRVYDECDELKPGAHFSFQPQEQADWNATLALCKNANEKATLWQMLGTFYRDEMESISQIYQLDPKSEKLDLLLSRAVNSYEQKFSFNGVQAYNYRQTLNSTNLPLRDLISKIAYAENTHKPWAWNMAAGYLYFLDSFYDKAKIFYIKAEKNLPADDLESAQLKLLQVLNKIGGAKRIDAKLENEILADLKWMNVLETNPVGYLRYSDALAWLKQTIAAKYKSQNELVKAECFYSNKAFYANRANAEKMKAFLIKPSKTPFENLCVELSVIKLDDIYEFQAIQLTFKDSIEGAISLLSKNSSAANVILPANPFNGGITDCHDCDHAAPQRTKYSRISFLQKLKELKENIRSGNDVYNNSLLLANAYYNITHFGNDRRFYECAITGSDHYSPISIDSTYRGMLTDMKLPAKYYQVALQSANDNEQKAKCHYMLAKCERDQYYNQHYFNNQENLYGANFMVDLSALNQFELLQKYPDTKFYKEVLEECGYFGKYVAK